MKNLLRGLIILLASPFLLAVGFIMVCICIPCLLATFFVVVIEYGFTGEWDWM